MSLRRDGKRSKTIAIHESEFGHKHQVIGGVRLFEKFSQGLGWHSDIFGWRFTFSFRFERQFLVLRRYNYHIRWRGYPNTPWSFLEIHCAFLRLTVGCAYGGWLAE